MAHLDKANIAELIQWVKGYVTLKLPKRVSDLEDSGDYVDCTSPQTITGTKTFNGSVIIAGRTYGVNKVLWSGNNKMGSSETITLSESISSQPHGIVLLWSYCTAEGVAENKYWNSIFVPKQFVQIVTGGGLSMILNTTPIKGNFIATKYLYINDNFITGYSGNDAAGEIVSNVGLNMRPENFALRYVIGV